MAVDTTEADYAHVLLPAVQFNVRLLRSRHFIRIIGEYFYVFRVGVLRFHSKKFQTYKKETKLFISASLVIIATMTRTMPAADVWARMEIEAGRYHHNNLMLLSWLEVCLKLENDTTMDLFRRTTETFLNKSPMMGL